MPVASPLKAVARLRRPIDCGLKPVAWRRMPVAWRLDPVARLA
jgi:hypothetical protein